jgi:protein-S-isoprenylcysteine O-methyltransferase Ste14
MKKLGNGNSRGIVEIVVLLVVALVIIFLMGLQPSDVWNKFAWPILEKSWEIVVAVAQAIANTIKDAV